MIVSRKILFIILPLFSFQITFSQKIYEKKDIVYDIDSIPVYVNFSTNKLATDSLYYIKVNGDLVKIECDIHYWGGDDQLNFFFDSIYYNRSNYNNQEMSDITKYCIIFDENLHIQDIRIVKRFHDSNDMIRNYIMVYNILLKTQGHWALNDKSTQSWHMYRGYHKFY
jgi:hypothetical protein